jgi:hypothetical protein
MAPLKAAGAGSGVSTLELPEGVQPANAVNIRNKMMIGLNMNGCFVM